MTCIYMYKTIGVISLTWHAVSDGLISCKPYCRTGTCMAGHCLPLPGIAEKPNEGSGMWWGLLKIKTHMKKHQESKWKMQLSSSQCTAVSVNIYYTFIYIAECRFIYMNHMLLPKSVMRMGSCSGISGRGRLLLDTLALLDLRGNLCFFCCKLLKWEAMCVFLWPDVRKILSQWGQGNGRTPKQWGKTAFRELAFRELIVMWLTVMYVLCTIKTNLHIN